MEHTIIVGGVNDADNKIFIRTDHHKQERDDDITGRPNFKPVDDRGTDFIPMELKQRPACLEPLPASPFDLFKEFVPVCLIEKWAGYKNNAPEPAQGRDRVLLATATIKKSPRDEGFAGHRRQYQRSIYGSPCRFT